ncbi:MAG: hypothetical protein CV087_16330 [Candidatus Brocadia sp. WS118]|nr:MAG: hypothetical protein CV087_16330 [Candidatus Brocadia sp. WS118]
MLKFIRNPRKIKIISITLLVAFMLHIILPKGVFALTAGPTSPEFSAFEPIATTDMVNTFSGDFKYNLPVIEIPGPDGAGYGLSLSYHSGASAEQEASWVGFGWTLNPGSITRDVRGFPDDYSDREVIQYKKTRPNWTYSSTYAIGNIEVFGADIPLNFNTSYIFNNYTGYSRDFGLGISVKGMAGLNMKVTDEGELTFSAYVNPVEMISQLWESIKKTDDSDNNNNSTKNEVEGKQLSNDQIRKEYFENKLRSYLKKGFSSSLTNVTSTYGLFTHSEVVRATSIAQYKGDSWNWTTKFFQVNPSMVPVGPEFSVSGNLNIQANIPRQKFQTYGYVNTPPSSGNNTMSDHYYENDSPYNKRDYNLGIPFNNHDQYTVMGEGLVGSFRYFSKKLGHFYPNFANSDTKIKSGGIEFMLGTNIGVGLDIGFGEQVFSANTWDKIGNTDNYVFDPSQAGFFRFNSDLGGKVEYSTYGTATAAESARVVASSNFPGTKKGIPNIPENIQNEITVTGSSSFIANTNVQQLDVNVRNNNRLNKNVNIQEIDAYLDNTNSLTNQKTIIEFKTTNESGMHHTYGLPVFASDEMNLQVSLETDRRDCSDVGSTSGRNCIEDNYIAYQDLKFTSYDGFSEPDISQYDTVFGELRKEPYVKDYLLTQITSHDYIDVGNNGPGKEDFGAWTNFHYHQKYSILNTPYHWRSPYIGMQFHKNSISDPGDDLAAVISGCKDVYYLKAIETKTHIAFFVTNKTNRSRFNNTFRDITLPPEIDQYIQGSQVERLDGLGAPEYSSNGDPAANSNSQKGITQRLEKLEKIVLFSKSRLDKPIKTVHFEYDYSLVKNLPNNVNGQFPNTNIRENSGKLTLKKVWFEYEGKYRTRISPYQFEYKYKPFPEDLNYFKSRFGEKNQEIFDYSNRFSGNVQNPIYEPYLLDSWGNVQPKARERHQDMNPWVYQGDIPKDPDGKDSFDPAAWQLKQIHLPSGGEILIQYEQKDYCFVQDRPAMAMMSIEEMQGDDKFYLNLSDFGIDPFDQSEVEALAQSIRDYYGIGGDGKEKIFFKFLYSLSGDHPNIYLASCNAEYISGYAKVAAVDVEQSGSRWRLKITLGSDDSGGGERTTLPRQACMDFYKSQRDGWNCNDCNYNRNLDIGLSIANKVSEIEAKPTPNSSYTDMDVDLFNFGLFLDLFGLEGIRFITRIGEDMETIYNSAVCKIINPRLSYFKIPMTKPKRGGGVRVKRLLMFDPGIEQGDTMIYGNEYSYIKSDRQSSGVATNEPINFAEENALVSFLPRKGQDWFSRLTAGMDKKQTEGPLGRSILPSPSVGHSRVEVKNIHSGKTGTGEVIHEFFTARDYPFDKFYNGEHDIAKGKGTEGTTLSDNEINDFMLIPAGLFNIEINNAFLGQGFRFILNDMHGQPKNKTTYGENDGQTYLTSMQKFEYYEPGEQILVLNPDNTFTYSTPGKEEDISLGMRKLNNNTFDISIELDVSIGICFPPPIFITPIPTVTMSERDLSTHVTSKVIRYPAILKAVTNVQDGSYTLTEFKGFDKFTGRPILTRTIDEFDGVKFSSDKHHDGSIYKLELPASYKYPTMQPIFSADDRNDFTNESNYNQLNDKTAILTSYGAEGFKLNPESGTWQMNNYIDASIQTYATGNSTAWFDQEIQETYEIPNNANNAAVLAKMNAIYRPYSSYVYKTPITSANEGTAESKVYNAGIFKEYHPFDWNNETSNTNNNWIKTIEVTRYSPHGYPVEEKNILGLYNSVKYGTNYNYTVPSVRSENAEYGTLAFEDFENFSGDFAHSGKGARQINSTNEIILENLYNRTHLQEVGGWLKLWMTKRVGNRADPFNGYNNNSSPKLSVSLNNLTTRIPLEFVARSGEWTLFRARIEGNHFSALPTDQQFSIKLNTDEIGNSVPIYIDDVRFQPYDSKVVCYVYDRETLRLIAQFDDQHFALFYQYDDEGRLTRKLIETERGIKTIQEARYNTPLQIRN